MRLPLTFEIDSRSGTSDKDERLTNCLSEDDEGATLAVVRPGLATIATASGAVGGAVNFNDVLISVYGTTLGVGIILGSSSVTISDTPDNTESMVTIDYINTEYMSFNIDSGTGQLITYVGDGTAWTPAAYGLVTGNAATSACVGPSSYVVVTVDDGSGYGSLMEVYKTSLTGVPSFSIVKSSNSYRSNGNCVYLNGNFIIPCVDVGLVIGARIYSSSDNGATFSSANIASFLAVSVAYDGSRWIVYGCDLGQTAALAYSTTDLTTFTPLTLTGLTFDYYPSQVVSFVGKYFAVCSSASLLPNVLFESLDGVAWTQVSDPQIYALYSLTVIGTTLYLGVTDGSSATSRQVLKTTDGYTFELVADVPDLTCFDVASDGQNLAGVGQDTGGFGRYFNDVITPASIPTVATISQGIYDFAQSPL